jgi:PPOX class probable F420-dependent enzyme
MKAMTHEEALAFLSHGTRTGKLATSSPGGTPHVAPVWFVLDGGDMVFTTGAASVKGRNLQANPRAALTVDTEVFPYDFVLARGPVTLDDDPARLLAWATTVAGRYVPPGRADEYGRRYSAPGELLCRLRIEHLTGFADVAA